MFFYSAHLNRHSFSLPPFVFTKCALWNLDCMTPKGNHPHSTVIFLWLILPQRKHFINNFTESWQFLFTEMNKIESATHNFRDPQVFWQFYKVSFVIQMGSPGVHGVGMEVFFVQRSRHGFSSAHSPPPLISGAGENRWRENSKWCIFFAPLETFGNSKNHHAHRSRLWYNLSDIAVRSGDSNGLDHKWWLGVWANAL